MVLLKFAEIVEVVAMFQAVVVVVALFQVQVFVGGVVLFLQVVVRWAMVYPMQ